MGLIVLALGNPLVFCTMRKQNIYFLVVFFSMRVQTRRLASALDAKARAIQTGVQ
jgi:hypothetical protein